MVDERAVQYIQQQRDFRVSDANIKKNAILGGFSEFEIDEAFGSLDRSEVEQPEVSVIPDTTTLSAGTLPEIGHARDDVPPAAPAYVVATATLGKFKASRLIVKESWGILKQDKALMWFPVISGAVATIAVSAL